MSVRPDILSASRPDEKPKAFTSSNGRLSPRIERLNSPVFTIISCVRFDLFTEKLIFFGESVRSPAVLMMQPLSFPSFAVRRKSLYENFLKASLSIPDSLS